MQGQTDTTRHEVTRNSTKQFKYTGNLFRKDRQLKVVY